MGGSGVDFAALRKAILEPESASRLKRLSFIACEIDPDTWKEFVRLFAVIEIIVLEEIELDHLRWTELVEALDEHFDGEKLKMKLFRLENCNMPEELQERVSRFMNFAFREPFSHSSSLEVV